jgi:hypothetical protein
MNRRGVAEAIWLLIGVIAGLTMLFLIFWILIPAFKNAHDSLSCGMGATKGTCKASCGDGEYRSWDGLFCKDEMVCCKPKTTNSIASGNTGAEQPKTVTLQPPEISIKRSSATKPLNEGQTEPLFPEETSPEYIITIKTYSEVNDADLKKCLPQPPKQGDVLDLSGRKVCVGQWNKTITIESQNYDLLYALTTIQGEKDWHSLNIVNGKDRNLPITFTKVSGSTVKKDGLFITTSNYKLSGTFGMDYNGQLLKLTVSSFPGLEKGDFPSIERDYHIYFKVSNGVTVSGLTPVWAQQKTVTVQCNPQILTCSDVYFYFVKKTDMEALAVENQKPGVEKKELQCMSGADFATELAKTPAVVVPTKTTTYCLQEGDDTSCKQEFPDLGRCDEARITMAATPEYTAALQSFSDAVLRRQLVQQTEASMQLYTLFTAQATRAAASRCVPKKQIPEVTPDPNAPNVNSNYKALFDPLTQKAVITLDQGYMTNTTICIYVEGANKKDANDQAKLYSVGKPQRVYIDTIPPRVEIKFSPWSLKLSFLCIDDYAGCKDTVGLAFISDVKKFLPALFKGPQSAATWCPPANTYGYGSAYEQRQARDASYNVNEVRVLCMRGEDNAGNTALTMVTVYPTYDLLATVISEVVNQ